LLVVPCEDDPQQPGCADPGAPVGGRISTSDSYFTANVSHTYSVDVPTDSAGNIATLTAPAELYRVESGYGEGNGASILQDVVPLVSDASGEVRVMRLDGGAPQEVNHLGQVMGQPESELDGTAVNWLAGLPNLDDHPELMTALTSGSGPSALQILGDRVTGPSLSVARLQTGAVLRGVDPDHFELSFRASAATQAGEAVGLAARFERGRNGRWAIQSLDSDAIQSTEFGPMRTRSRMKFLGRRVVVNEERDAMRAVVLTSRRRMAGWLPKGTRTRAVAQATLPPIEEITSWNPPGPLPFPIVPPTVRPPVWIPDPPNVDLVDCDDASEPIRQLRAGTNVRRVAFQHGFGSGACTWRWMLGAVSSLTPVRVVSNTPSFSPYESQASQLRDRVLPIANNGWVFVGHSNGGVISRYAAQTYRSPQQLARAVITINSPHFGAQAMAPVSAASAAIQNSAFLTRLLFRQGGIFTEVFGAMASSCR
jgi:hypothetical protein